MKYKIFTCENNSRVFDIYLSPADHLHGLSEVPQCLLVVLTVLQRDGAMEMTFKQLSIETERNVLLELGKRTDIKLSLYHGVYVYGVSCNCAHDESTLLFLKPTENSGLSLPHVLRAGLNTEMRDRLYQSNQECTRMGWNGTGIYRNVTGMTAEWTGSIPAHSGSFRFVPCLQTPLDISFDPRATPLLL